MNARRTYILELPTRASYKFITELNFKLHQTTPYPCSDCEDVATDRTCINFTTLAADIAAFKFHDEYGVITSPSFPLR